MVVVVSEETGTISVAVNGMLKRHLAPQTLSKLLKNELDPQTDEEQQGLFGKVKKKFEKKDKQETDRPKEKKKLFRKKAKDDNDAKQ